ncbi:hypothetical protein BH23CHL2_BH23CHL2_24410 [soil metagenome]
MSYTYTSIVCRRVNPRKDIETGLNASHSPDFADRLSSLLMPVPADIQKMS